MSIKLASVAGICADGKRKNNEDFIYPDPATVGLEQRRFIVCDGVGGSLAGEVASRLTATAMDTYLTQLDTETYSATDLQTALITAQNELSAYVKQQPAAQDLATTITILQIQTDRVLVGHVGDSRIYQLRAGEIIFKTADHSLVNELLSEGLISPSQAATHPQRNVITRAVQTLEAGKVELEIHQISDVQKDDYFLLCTDGILEGFTELALQRLFADSTQNAQTIIDLLRAECDQFAQDNFSAYVLQIASATASKQPQNESAINVFARPLPLLPLIILFLVGLFLFGHFFCNQI